MVELREVDTARAMLRQTQVFNRMKQEEPDRFLKLEHLCGRTYFDIRCAESVVGVSINVAGDLMVSCCNMHARVFVLGLNAYLHSWPSAFSLCKTLGTVGAWVCCNCHSQLMSCVVYREVYAGTSKEKRRAQIAHSLSQEVSTVPPQRLMALIGQALKW